MNEQHLNELAVGIMTLIEDEDPSESNIGVRGTVLINEFLGQPGVEASLAALDVEKKVRLWGTKGSGMQILFHGADTPKKGSPHDHGQSWALYFQVTGMTKMTTYKRVVGGPGQPGEAVLEKIDEKDVKPGDSMFFGPQVIHSTQHSAPPARWIRVTGTDLDFAERLRFSIERKEAMIEKKN